MIEEQLTQFKDLVTQAAKILILTGENPNKDAAAAALSLHLVLEKLGKEVKTACPTSPTVELSEVIGINKMSSDLGSRDLIISFDYIEGSIDKVSYNVEGDKFNLVVHSSQKGPSLSADRVHFSSSSGDFNLALVIGTPSLTNLGNWPAKEKKLFSEVFLVNIDHHPQNSLFGRLNLVEKDSSSTSQIVAQIIKNLNFPLDVDSATNLFLGIVLETGNLDPWQVSPQALEAAAFCLRAGARRPQAGKTRQIPTTDQDIVLENRREDFSSQEEPVGIDAQDNIEPDWLRPKIYKSTSNL